MAALLWQNQSWEGAGMQGCFLIMPGRGRRLPPGPSGGRKSRVMTRIPYDMEGEKISGAGDTDGFACERRPYREDVPAGILTWEGSRRIPLPEFSPPVAGGK